MRCAGRPEEARVRAWELELVTVQPPPPVPGARSPVDAAVYAYMWMGVPPPTSGSDADIERRREQLAAHWRHEAESRLEDELRQLDPAALPEKVTRSVIGADHPARALLDMAEWAQLLVVGSRGLGGFAGMLLGSVSQQCVRHATSPVLVLPSDR